MEESLNIALAMLNLIHEENKMIMRCLLRKDKADEMDKVLDAEVENIVKPPRKDARQDIIKNIQIAWGVDYDKAMDIYEKAYEEMRKIKGNNQC